VTTTDQADTQALVPTDQAAIAKKAVTVNSIWTGVPATKVSSTSAREGAWSDPADWTPEDERDIARGRDEAPVSYRGRGPRGYTRSDERLLETVCEQLTDDPRIDASDIEVEVNQQVVTLRGSVPDRRTKYAVEELVEDAGARDIENQLRVNVRR
jgi:osmotically-inducible protein OsmY